MKTNNNISEIAKLIKSHMEILKNDYKVKNIGIFGSFVENKQDEDSDIDILVDFSEPIDFFKFIQLEEYLGKLLGKKVDLVSKKALKPFIGKNILKEVVYI